MPIKKWLSPIPGKCDLCSKPLVDTFVDGKTSFGPWGIMCRPCHRKHGIGLGLGRGQLYDISTALKLEG